MSRLAALDARSMLFVPGSRADRFDKALGSGTDLVIVDLEDAVAADGKDGARGAALGWEGLSGAALRVNALGTPWHDADLAAVTAAATPPAAVMLPKADAASVAEVAHVLPPDVELIALVESARGIRDAYDLAGHERVGRLVFGSVDYALDVGVTSRTESEDELLYARSVLVTASRAAGIAAPVDGVTLALEDSERVEREARRARDLGFSGKLCIHPAQVEPVHMAFRPSEADLAWAVRVVAAAGESGGAAVRFEGEVMDAPRLAQACRWVDEAGAGEPGL